MKWTLERQTGYDYVFECNGFLLELKVYAKTLEEAVTRAKMVLREGTEIDVSGWEE